MSRAAGGGLTTRGKDTRSSIQGHQGYKTCDSISESEFEAESDSDIIRAPI
jgi:hypothetical protein